MRWEEVSGRQGLASLAWLAVLVLLVLLVLLVFTISLVSLFFTLLLFSLKRQQFLPIVFVLLFACFELSLQVLDARLELIQDGDYARLLLEGREGNGNMLQFTRTND